MSASAREPLLRDYQSYAVSPSVVFVPPSAAPSTTGYSAAGSFSQTPQSFVFGPPLGQERRRWRGHFLACCGFCSGIDCLSCLLSTVMPCCAFGRNMQRALSLGFFAQLVMYFLLVYVCWGVALSLVTTCVADRKAVPECGIATAVVNVAYWSLLSSFALYAGYRRHQMRKRFLIEGSECGDYVTWLCCPTCALAQETRTLAHNNVDDGVWLGPQSPRQSPSAAAYSATNPQPGTFLVPASPPLQHMQRPAVMGQGYGYGGTPAPQLPAAVDAFATPLSMPPQQGYNAKM